MTAPPPPVRVVFLGTAAFAVPALRALAESGSEPVAVYTQPDRPAGRGRRSRPSPVKDAAEKLGLDVFQPPDLRGLAEAERLRSLAPTVLVLAAYGRILPGRLLQIPPRGGLNVHPSLLPAYRGPSPVATAILDGETRTGVSIFSMDAGMDSGPVIARRELPIGVAETTATLTGQLADRGADLLVDVLEQWVDGSIAAEPQDPEMATTTRLLRREDGVLDFSEPAETLARKVRAFDPWPGTATTVDGQRFSVRVAHPMEIGEPAGRPGQVVALANGRTGIVAGGGSVLALDRVQIAGKRPVGAAEFARGRRDFVGTILPS